MSIRRKINRAVFVVIFTAVSISGIQCTSVKPVEKQKTEKSVDHKKFRELFRSAKKLTPQEAVKLDKLVDKEPYNLDAAAKWLIYNSNKSFRKKKLRKKREKIILNLIKNHPKSMIFSHYYANLYEYVDDIATADKLWEEQFKKHPEDLEILSNGAYHLLFYNRKLCEKFLKKGQELEPDNPAWSTRLGSLYRYNSFKDKKEYIKSYNEYKRAYKQSAVDKRSSIINSLGQIAYILGEYKDAQKYAAEMLELGKKASRKYEKGTCLYNANTLLGMLALKDGKTEEACKYLIKSGEILVSEKLPDFHVDMSLACMLTFKKQDKCVLKYLETVDKYSPRANCKAYIEDLKAGVMPEYRSIYNYGLSMDKVYTARRKQFLNIGKTLSAEQAAVLEKELAKLPAKDTTKAYGTITKLVAYYYVNKDKDKSIPEKRRQLIYRLVEYFPRYSLLAYPETWLRGKKDDKLIALCRASIKKSKAGDACPLHKAAYQVATHDDKLAEEGFLKSFKTKPGDAELKKALDKFHARVKAEKPYGKY